jgi:hypothetical protein
MANTLNITNLTLSIDSNGTPSFSNGKYNYIIKMTGNYVSLKAGTLKIYMYDSKDGNEIFELLTKSVTASDTDTINVNINKESTRQSIDQFILKAEFTASGSTKSAWSGVMVSSGLSGKTNEATPGVSLDD